VLDHRDLSPDLLSYVGEERDKRQENLCRHLKQDSKMIKRRGRRNNISSY
jgi:hypothetical protein